MILTDNQSFQKECEMYPMVIRKAIDFIHKENLADKPVGKYEIEGDAMFALVQEVMTNPRSIQRPESHRNYIDVQYLVSGEEKMEWLAYTDKLPVQEVYSAQKDIQFYEGDQEDGTEFILKPGMFAVFYPTDVHRPCCCVKEPMSIKKIVIKIHRDLF